MYLLTILDNYLNTQIDVRFTIPSYVKSDNHRATGPKLGPHTSDTRTLIL